MEPFVVRWQLTSPMVVPERPIHLDVLLASVGVDALVRLGRPLEEALTAQVNLPLEKAFGPDGDWVWKASQLLLSPSSPPSNVPMTRRVDVETMAADRDRIFSSRRQAVRIGTGPFRNYDMRVGFDVEAMEAALRLKQGLGRLIRREGVTHRRIWMMDGRLLGRRSGYFKRVFGSLLLYSKRETFEQSDGRCALTGGRSFA